jgi:hypothetical protein
MDMLGQLLGGGQQRKDYSDFINRYQQGQPWDGISDQEALDRYGQIAPQLPAETYRESAEQAFSRLSPQERGEFARYLQSRTRDRSLNIPDLDRDGIDDRAQKDPGYLANVTTQMHQQQPDLLGQLLGGAGGQGGLGGALSSPIAKAALAGIAAMAAQKFLGGRS